MSVEGSEAQLTVTRVRSFLRLILCIARATRLFPRPRFPHQKDRRVRPRYLLCPGRTVMIAGLLPQIRVLNEEADGSSRSTFSSSNVA